MDFPSIEPPHPRNQLATLDLTQVALAKFGEWKPQVAALKEKYRSVVWDMATPKGLNDAKKARQEVREPRYKAQNISQSAKSELAGVSKAIGAEEEAIVAAVREIEDPIHELITQREQQIDAEKEFARQAEARRQQTHRDNIAQILRYATQAVGKPAEKLAAGIGYVEQIDVGGFEEFAEEAEAAKADTLAKLREMHARTLQTEEDARKAEAQRIENERIAAELAERKRQLDAEAAELRRLLEAQTKPAPVEQIELVPDQSPVAQRPETSGSESALATAATAAPEERQVFNLRQSSDSSPDAARVLAGSPGDPLPVELGMHVVPVEFTVSTPLPAGLELHPKSGTVSGVPLDAPHNLLVTVTSRPAPIDDAPINLGEIAKRLGFSLSCDFITQTLGLPYSHKVKASTFWPAADWPRICSALIDHIGNKGAEHG